MNITEKLYGLFEKGDLKAIDLLLTAHPQLLERDDLLGRAVRHGSLPVVKHMLKAGAKNVQKALSYIVYGNKKDVAEFLVKQGANMAGNELEGHVLIGACEVLNPEAMDIILELADPPSQEDLWRCMAMLLCTYTRKPEEKHLCIQRLESMGYELPDTLPMAFHKGDLKTIAKRLKGKTSLINETYSLEDIYPSKLVLDPTDGLHLTPLEGSTLLHMAVEYHETDLLSLLLELEADVNALAAIGQDGFGGHTALFHTVVSYTYYDNTKATKLLNYGANPNLTATLKKQLKHMGNKELEEAYVFTDVTPTEYARQFQVQDWVSQPSIEVINLHQSKAFH